MLPFSGAHAFTFNSPMVDAAETNDAFQMKKLIEAGYSPDSKGDFGVTALMRAAYHGRADMVQFLLDSGAYVNEADIGGATALHLAAGNGHKDVIEILIEYDAYIDIPDKEQWTPLMRATMAKKDKTVDFLVSSGANISLTNNLNQSVLMHAAMVGNKKILEILLESKGFPSLDEGQKQSAIELADKRGNEKAGQMISATIGYIKKAKNPNKKSDYNNYSDYVNRFEDGVSQEQNLFPSEESAVANNSFALQLGAFNSPDQTAHIWGKMQRKFPDVLGGLDLKIIKSKAENGDYLYRLLAGYFAWKNSAESSCSSMRVRNVACFVVPVSEPSNIKDGKFRNRSLSGEVVPVLKPDLIDFKGDEYNSDVAPQPYGRNISKTPAQYREDTPWLSKGDSLISAKAEESDPVAMEEIRKMLRKEFFDDQGLQIPEISKSNEPSSIIDPSKSVRPHTPIARAVQVPDSKYFAGENTSQPRRSPSDNRHGDWVKIGNFPDRISADDYATRMFRYDEMLNGLSINIVSDANRYGNIVSIQMGAVSPEQVSFICQSAIAGGLKCAVTNKSGKTKKKTPKPQNRSKFSPDSYWINLGTFSNSPEAEYYWMFLNEDNADVLDHLKYNIVNSTHGSFGADAVQLRVGPFGAESRASQVCNVIKYRNIACIVTQ